MATESTGRAGCEAERPPPLPGLLNPGQYLREHIGKELDWLLRAANEWSVQHELDLCINGYHTQVYAMDSAFLHARTLFEFFTRLTSEFSYGVDQFGLQPLRSRLYEGSTGSARSWKGALHEYLMHAQPRDNPRPLRSFDRQTLKNLNRMPLDFAHEIVRLWISFSGQLRASEQDELADLAESILSRARKDAEIVLSKELRLRRLAMKELPSCAASGDDPAG